MVPTPRKPNASPAATGDGMKGLLGLLGRDPKPARVILHIERLLAGWREALDPDSYAERLDTLRESLVEGIALTEEGAGDIDPASAWCMDQGYGRTDPNSAWGHATRT